jgi:hypothetical protein
VRVVLYAHDFEPITVISLDPHAYARLHRGGTWQIAVMPPLRLRPYAPDQLIKPEPFPIVTITADVLRKGEHETLMLFTHDEEPALLLRSALLPGQRKDHRDDYLDGFRDGFLRAINSI